MDHEAALTTYTRISRENNEIQHEAIHCQQSLVF
jgi:hypothetical protein